MDPGNAILSLEALVQASLNRDSHCGFSTEQIDQFLRGPLEKCLVVLGKRA